MTFSRQNVILINFNVMWLIESYIRAPVLLNLFNSLQKSDNMLGNPHILKFSPICLTNYS